MQAQDLRSPLGTIRETDTCGDTHLNSPLSTTMLREALSVINTSGTARNNAVLENIAYLRQLFDVTKVSPADSFQMDPQNMLHRLSLCIPHAIPDPEWRLTFNRLWTLTSKYCPLSLKQFHVREDPARMAQVLENVIEQSLNGTLVRYQWISDFLIQGAHLTARPTEYQSEDHLQITPGWQRDPIRPGLYYGDLREQKIQLQIWLNQKYVIMRFEGQIYLTTRLHYLMISDVIEQRTAGLFCAELAGVYQRSNYPDASLLLNVYKIGDILLDRYGNSGYQSVALWEALVIGTVLSRQDDPVVDNKIFLAQMVSEFVKSQGHSQETALKGFWKIEIRSLLRRTNKHQLFELFGLHRIWGHPTICETAGIRKLKSIACRPRALDIQTILTIGYKFRENFCFTYWRRNKTWPLMTIDPKAPPSALLTAIREGRVITALHPAYKLSDWKYIKFSKIFSVPAKFELSELISDKATSFPISKLIDSCLRNHTIGSSSERNVIMQWLQTNYNDPIAFCDKIDQEGFNPDEKCIGLHPKERELKIEARFFGLLPLEKRLYVVLTEAMIANNLLEYFPDITMCFDSATLQQRIYTNTQSQEKKYQEESDSVMQSDHAVVVNLDFNKWNSYMREEETLSLFKDMDNMFGYERLISRTHEMFTESTMYLADGTITPIEGRGSWIFDERVWNNHLGGIEGLRQKGWTIFTVIILKYVCDQAGLRCSLMGQGDNQVLILYYKQKNRAAWKNIHQNFVDYLNLMVKYIGPPLKIEETWSSSNLFIYGKFPVWNGSPQSMALKKLIKLSVTTNDGLQSLVSACSSIAANCSAAAGADYDPTIPFIFGTYVTMKTFRLHITSPFFASVGHNTHSSYSFRVPVGGAAQTIYCNFSESSKRDINKFTDDLLMGLLLIPSILGGYPSLQFCDLASHGFPDPLSLNIWSLRQIYTQASLHWKALCPIIDRILAPQPASPPSYHMLMEDPVSINILRPSSEKDKLKMMVMKFLSRLRVPNVMFVTFLRIAETSQEILVNSLANTNRINPRICNSILKATQVGRALAVVGKVDKTRTMTGCMLKADRVIMKELLRQEYEEFEYDIRPNRSVPVLFSMFAKNYTNSVFYQLYRARAETTPTSLIDCSTRYAQHLRDNSWKKTIEGVTVAPPQEIFSIHPTNGMSCTRALHPNLETGKVTIILDTAKKATFNHRDDPLEMAPGPFKPYFGTRTQTKVKWEGNELKAVAPPAISGALDILCIPGWGTGKDSNLAQLIYAVVESYTDLEPRNLTPHTTEMSGSIVHRFQDQRTSHKITPSILWNNNTHLNILTNDYKPENLPQNLGFKNFNFAYQSLFSYYASYISSQYINRAEFGYQSLHLHTECRHCVLPVPEEFLDIEPCENAVLFLRNMRDPSNPYLYVGQDVIQEEIVIRPKFITINKTHVPPEHLPSLFSLALVSRYLEEMGTSVVEGENRIRIAEKQFMIPVSACKILNQLEFFFDLAFVFFLSFIHGRSLSLIQGGRITVRGLINEALGACHQQDPIWFKGLLPLLLNIGEYQRLRSSKADLLLPAGTPPSDRTKCIYFHQILRHCASILAEETNFDTRLKQFLQRPPLQSPLMCLHPLFLINLQRCLSPEREVEALGVKCIRNFRRMECSRSREGRLDSIVDLMDIFVAVRDSLECPNLLPLHKQDMDKYIISHREGYTSHLDYLIKEVEIVGGYQPYQDCSLPSSHNIKLEDLVTLDPALNVVYSLPSVSNIEFQAFRYQLEFMSLTMPDISLYNHLFKVGAPGTSAPFKLLSILQWLYTSGIPGLPSSIMSGAILGAGDGIGGFTATLGRIFIVSDLILYTLFDTSLLNSTGVDRFTPAALGFHPDILSRVNNLDMLLEADTDLTREGCLHLLHREYSNFPIIICDAEGGGWEDPTKGLAMLRNLLIFAGDSQTIIFLFKTYLSRPDMVYAQMTHMGVYFKHVYIVRSLFSTINNTEVYLVGVHLRQGYPGIREMATTRKIEGKHLLQMRGTVTNFPTFESFIAEILPLHNFDLSPNLQYQRYIQLLSPPGWLDSLKRQLASYLFSVGVRNSGPLEDPSKLNEEGNPKMIINYPGDIVYKWRNYLRPVAFSSQNPSNYYRNFLTRPLMAAMAHDLLLVLGLTIYTKEQFDDFSRLLNFGWIQFYPTLDGSWGFHLSHTRYDHRFSSKSVNINELLPSARQKELITNVGVLKLISHNYHIYFYGRNSKNPTPKYIFDGIEAWWNHLGKQVMSLSLTPVASRKVKDIHNNLVWVKQDWNIPYPESLELQTFLRVEWTQLLGARLLSATDEPLPACLQAFGRPQIEHLRARRRYEISLRPTLQ